MPLASLEDINLHLPDDKIEVDEARYAPMQLDAERIVRGYMAGYFTPAILSTWLTPATTPELIRAIAGRLVAAFYYRERYSEDSLDDPQYAQNKYNEAMSFINAIIDGSMVVELLVGTVEPTGHFSINSFWPNETTDGPKFTMTQEL